MDIGLLWFLCVVR